MITRQSVFTGGVDLISSEVQIPNNAYKLLINARNRFGFLAPVEEHVELANVPAGLKQGLASIGNVLIEFVAGSAYYNVDGTTTWTQIEGFHMSTTAAQYWTQAVPASSFNFTRHAAASVTSPLVIVNTTVSGTPQALVVQDGVNQPFLIIYDIVNASFTARPAGTYGSWTNVSATANDREYVPIGREMFTLGGCLHIVAPDRKKVYRSVTGRMLDFMVNVKASGDKNALAADGDANTVSYTFDFNEITCIKAINTPDAFIYATAKNVRVVVADYNSTIFDEPTFRVVSIIDAGIVNQYSALEIIGDYLFIDFEALKSFNAVQQAKVEGNVDITSLPISRMVDKIRQTNCSCVNINNFALFNLDTVYGNVFAVYDMLRNVWTAIDITPALKIKQFAVVQTDEFYKLYAISFDDRTYHLYGAETTFPAQLQTKAYLPDAPKAEHSASWFKPLFEGGTIDGQMRLTVYVDGIIDESITQTLNTSVGAVTYPVRPPVRQASVSRVDNPGFQLQSGKKGKAISFVLEWNTDHRLLMYEVETSEDISITSGKQSTQVIKDTYGS